MKTSPGANNPEEFLLSNVRIVQCVKMGEWGQANFGNGKILKAPVKANPPKSAHESETNSTHPSIYRKNLSERFLEFLR